tara:strand:+ start:938 stop:1060 length:123 start_codon:yes stop_codon:yes gene_type:complete
MVNFNGQSIDSFALLLSNTQKFPPKFIFQRYASAVTIQGE